MTNTTPTAPQDALIKEALTLCETLRIAKNSVDTVPNSAARIFGYGADMIEKLLVALVTPPVPQAASAEGESVGMEEVRADCRKRLMLPWSVDHAEAIRIKDCNGDTLATMNFTHLRGKRPISDVEMFADNIVHWVNKSNEATPSQDVPLEQIVNAVIERAEQACRYVLKHQNFERDDAEHEKAYEAACSVCERAIRPHVERHMTELALLRPSDGWNRDMSKAPREEETDCEIDARYILQLFDPDKEAWCRVTIGYWNEHVDSWTACDDAVGKINPIAWCRMAAPPSPEAGHV